MAEEVLRDRLDPSRALGSAQGGPMNHKLIDLDLAHDHLQDFFSRLHHDVETAEIRAASVVALLAGIAVVVGEEAGA